MCEANVYLIDEHGEELLIFKSVAKIEPYRGGLCLENIFYQRKYIMAKIVELSLVTNKILLERII